MSFRRVLCAGDECAPEGDHDCSYKLIGDHQIPLRTRAAVAADGHGSAPVRFNHLNPVAATSPTG